MLMDGWTGSGVCSNHRHTVDSSNTLTQHADGLRDSHGTHTQNINRSAIDDTDDALDALDADI